MLRRVIQQHMHVASSALESATTTDQVKFALQSTIRAYIDDKHQSVPQSGASDIPNASELLQLEKNVLETLEKEQQDRISVKDAWYADHFSTFADVLLSVVAADWLSSFLLQEKVLLFHVFFAEAPASILLPVLVTHLSSVAPLREALSAAEASTYVTAIAADTAAAILAERFALPGSTGVQELAATCGTSGDGKGGSSNEPPTAYLASLLASVPERAASTQLPALRPPAYIPQVVQHCMRMLSDGTLEPLKASIGGVAAQEESAEDSRPAGGTISTPGSFVGEVLARLCRRGHAQLVATSLWSAFPRIARRLFPEPSADGLVDASPETGQNGISGASLAAADADISARMDSHAAASSSKTPAEAKLGRASKSKASSGSKFAFPDPRTNQQQSSPSQQERYKQQERVSEEQISDKLEAASQQQREAQEQKAEISREVLEGCATVRSAMQTVVDATALERLLEAVLREAARDLEAVGPHEGALEHTAENLATILDGPLLTRPEIRYFLEDKALLRKTLPPNQMRLLVRLLGLLCAPQYATSPSDFSSPLLQQAAVRLAQTWGHKETTQRLPVRQQAYMSAVLEHMVASLGKEGLEGTPGLFGTLLSAVSTRLDSPQPLVRRQSMRVGQAFSKVLDPSKHPLFSDLGDLGLQPEEAWHRDCLPATLKQSKLAAFQPQPAERAGNATVHTSTADDNAYSDEFEPFDLSEEDDDGLSEGANPLQLRDVAALLRKSDDHNAVLKGLAALGPLIDAAPHELDSYAGELARALLHARPPEWADEEAAAAGRPETAPAARRLAGMAALAVAAPRAGGLALAAEVYSPHVDLHQRLTLLEALSTAARQLALGLPQGLPTPITSVDSGEMDTGSRQVGKSRVWGIRSMARQRQGAPRTHRNRFVEVAAEWSAALLSGADQERHGVDLFGRDALLLGRIITCQGTFVECAAPAAVTLRLAAALLELLAAREVHAHPEPTVRRSALIAVSQVMGAMPAAGLAGLLSGGGVAEGTLVDRLEWVRGWTEATAAADSDSDCRVLAGACRSLQGKLAQEAMQALELGADGGMRQALHQAPDIIIPPSSSVPFPA
ncbi:g2714 [Coccomyxa elongata]